MKALADLRFFVRAARCASLSEAARALGASPAAASAAIKRLEAELRVPLFVRSTRSLRLTPQGEQFLARCEPALDTLSGALDDLAAGQGALSGHVNLTVPSDLGRNLVLTWIDEFLQRHPGVQVRVHLSDHLAGIYREQIDLALRYGEAPDSNLIPLPVAPGNRRVLCAAPGYLRRFGAPATPQALQEHNCLCFMLNGRVHDRWTFTKGREKLSIAVRGRVQTDDGDAVRRLAVAGGGIAYKSALDVEADLSSGALVRLLPEWQTEAAPLYMMCADRRLLRPAVRSLWAHVSERCQALCA